MGSLKLTSPGILLILAVVAVAGIFFLDMCYLQPHMEKIQVVALGEQAAQIDQGVVQALHNERTRLAQALRLTELADRPTDQQCRDIADLAGAEVAWTTDTSAPQEGGAASPHASAAGGLAQIGGQAVVFAGRALPAGEHGPSAWMWLASPVEDVLPEGVGVVQGQISPAGILPAARPDHQMWWVRNDAILAVSWPAVGSAGEDLGHFQATVPVRQIHRQAVTSRRIVLIVLALSVGLASLIILGVHALVAGPNYRLLKRLKDLSYGDVPKDLTHHLHGESLALARHLEAAFDHLAEMSRTDELTGLANRRYFTEVLEAFYVQARRYNRPLSLIVLDVDFFKAVNDSAGHQAGDDLLKIIAKALDDACRQADMAARLGGDEFAVLLPETTCHDAEALAERIRRTICGREVRVGSLVLQTSVSMGLTDLNVSGVNTADAMQAAADRALYQAKEQGRNRLVKAQDVNGLAPSAEHGDRQVSRLCKKLAGLDGQFKGLFLNAMSEVVEVLEARNPHMADHAQKVQRYAALLAREIKLADRVVNHIETAAMLHDIGMLTLPDSLVACQGRLSDEQTRLLRQHPVISARLMEGMAFLEQETPAVRHHHERYDGQGYPDGLAGAAIPLPARILCIADAFDAMTTSRPWRKAMSADDALAELHRSAGSHFDPALVEAFVALAERHGPSFCHVDDYRATTTS